MTTTADRPPQAALPPVRSEPMLADSVASCIDHTVEAIIARLNAKGPMYVPDAEWTRLQVCAEALRRAKRELTAQHEKENA